MEKVYNFTCDNCGMQWRSDNSDLSEYSDGYQCPNCGSKSIEGDEIK